MEFKSTEDLLDYALEIYSLKLIKKIHQTEKKINVGKIVDKVERSRNEAINPWVNFILQTNQITPILASRLLLACVRQQKKKFIPHLLDQGASIYHKDFYKKTSLDYVIINDDFKAANFFLKTTNLLSLENLYKAFLPYLRIMPEKKFNIWFDFIIKFSGGVNTKDGNKKTLLDYTVECGDFNLIEMLFSKGAKLNVEFVIKKIKSHVEVEKWTALLLKANTNLDYQDHDGKTALMYLIANGYKKLAKKLIENGANVSLVDRDYNKALDFAMLRLDFQSMYLIFENGGKSFKFDSLFNQAFENRYNKDVFQKLVNFIIHAKININYHNPHGQADPIVITCAKQKKRYLLKVLLENNIDLSKRDSNGLTALDYAFSSDLGVAHMLSLAYPQPQKIVGKLDAEYNSAYWSLFFSTKSPVNTKDSKGNSALIYAVKHNNLYYVAKLIHAGCDINLANYSGQSAIDFALENFNIESTKFLIKNDAVLSSIKLLNFIDKVYYKNIFKEILQIYYSLSKDINEKNSYNKTILYYLAKSDNLIECRRAIKKGANSALLPPLETIITGMKDIDFELLNLFLNNGAKISNQNFFPDRFGFCNADKLNKLIELMILCKIDINTKQQDSGNTALHCAVRLKSSSAIRLLLNAEADCGVLNKNNKRPFDSCDSKDSHEMLLCGAEIELKRATRVLPKKAIQLIMSYGFFNHELEAKDQIAYDEMPLEIKTPARDKRRFKRKSCLIM